MARGDNDIPVLPGPRHVQAPPKPSGGTPSGGGRSGGGGGGGGGRRGGGGGGGTPFDRATAGARGGNRAAIDSYRDQARMLQRQADSLRAALSGKGFKRALNIRLGNIRRDLAQQSAVLMEGYTERLEGLELNAKDNEAAEGGASYGNLTNRARERMNAVAQAVSNGAGESDLLRTEQMSLRNWDGNQAEVNRAYFDSLRSINSSLSDLNADTKTGRVNLWLQAGEDREMAYQNYYNQMSETWTQLGNTLGQKAQILGQSSMLSGNKYAGGGGAGGDRRGVRGATRGAGAAFDRAAGFAGRAYRDPGVPTNIMDWEGQEAFEGGTTNSVLMDDYSAEGPQRKKPEGATLRKW